MSKKCLSVLSLKIKTLDGWNPWLFAEKVGAGIILASWRYWPPESSPQEFEVGLSKSLPKRITKYLS